MDEREWLNAADPREMLAFLRRKDSLPRRVLGLVRDGAWRPSHRKLRLFACSCCRRGCNLPEEEPIREVVQTSERYADGLADRKELRAAADRAQAWLGGSHAAAGAEVGNPDVWKAVSWEAEMNGRRVAAGRHRGHSRNPPPDRDLFSARLAQERDIQCHLFRDIFGPLPFRPLPPLPPSVRTWNDGLIVKLATSIYGQPKLPEGTLDRDLLAVLADALEEGGVTDQDLLGHLRRPGAVHVRGCFAVDFVLGKE